MATLDSDVPMVPVGEASSSAGPSSTKKPKRFEIKKWNAVALWAWGSFETLIYSSSHGVSINALTVLFAIARRISHL